MNQYFAQKGHTNSFKIKQIDSPKDSSIERARVGDIVQQEAQSIQNLNKLASSKTLQHNGKNVGL